MTVVVFPVLVLSLVPVFSLVLLELLSLVLLVVELFVPSDVPRLVP